VSTDATFRFFSWVRRGAATQIQPKDMQESGPARAAMQIDVTVDGAQQPAGPKLTLQGPGDVVGFDARAVVRVWPPPDTHDAEPNYFPLVEFDQTDLPWRYTPRRGNDSGRLRPWLCLIALKEKENENENEFVYEPPRSDRALGKVTIAAGTPMPRLDQAWAWAHVQVSGVADNEPPLQDIVTKQPERCLARLLCPRRLDPHTVYWAMLVPVFEEGRCAGLRELVTAPTTLGQPWTLDANRNLAAQVDLPVYYRWRFGTGAGGDFESLVQQLTPRALPATVGTRPIDVTQPGGGLPPAATEPLAIGGALQAPTTVPPPWPTEEKAAFVSALASRLNIPAQVFETGGGSVVAPPLYGQWHAKKVRLEPTQDPPWFQHLNEDPRARVAAALGTAVVQDQQHELMASAWEQVAGIREVNDQLRKAQLARAIGERLHVRFVQPADADGVLTFTGATHGHLRHGSKTVRALAQQSPVYVAPLGGAFRRLMRPLGPTGRRQARPDQPAAPLVSRINDGTYDNVLVATPPASTSLPTPKWMAKQGVPWKGPPSDAEIKAQPARPDIVAWDPVYGRPPGADPSPVPNEDSPSMARFRDAAIAFAQRQVDPAAGETLYRMAMSAIRTTIVSAVDPKLTIPASIGPRLVRTAGFPWNPPDPIEPVMAHPEFPQPMYKPLAALSQDWVLPGLSDIPANTVALAITNPAFIEAYLVGLNHEMARELLWREYPTDQRGSYFRQFWDPAGLAPTPVPETAKDIRRLHEWLTTSDLGTHSPRPVPPSPDGRHLVLLVRGEVLRRYPGTLVYAQRAEGTIGHRILATPIEQRRPVFAGRLRPDVAFFGFELTVEQARGGTTDPGWFFVFEEQPGEPRFGLDVSAEGAPASWDQLAWTHLVGSAEELATLGYIDLAATLPNTTTIQQPGGAGWHVDGPGVVARGADHAAITFQRPVRVAVHASEMLP